MRDQETWIRAMSTPIACQSATAASARAAAEEDRVVGDARQHHARARGWGRAEREREQHDEWCDAPNHSR